MSDERAIALERMQHMLEAADAIAEYVARGRTVFDADQAVRDAILFRVVVIGEAAKAVVQRDPALANVVRLGSHARPNHASVLGHRFADHVGHRAGRHSRSA